ncbi:energy transducer TonB [Nitrosomonas supralitoralis]|uniref:Protein TonB n=1 Tax=Nitrosomonas supralitoralis TaxID=2116706 RepID=A0A2P7NU69_9PROT|nr:energy transducer TonB [Nitrosomonas supralitoralis]PSJ16985.1 energy transducer TonB [Nitrosomonas supralitoralis]
MKQHFAGAVSMLFGLVLVFGLIIILNHYLGKIERTPPQEVTEISMTREIKQEPKKEIKKVEPKRQVSRPQAPTPFKGLDTALSGIDLGSLGLNNGQRDIDDSLLGKTGNAVMTADLVDIPPRPIARGSFKYPPTAKRKGVKGYVVLSVLVETDGSVNQVQVLESSPSGIFDAAALQGIRAWQFEPAKYKGDTVRVWAKQKIRFDLS